jgi:hypothetical protein
MGSPYTNTKRKRAKNGKQSKPQRLFRLMVYLGAISISLAAVYTLVAFIRGANDAAVEVEWPYGSLIELTEPDFFKQSYLSVNCNEALLESTQTIRVDGVITNGTESQAFMLIKKRPNWMLFTIDGGSHQMTFGVSGDVVWRRIRGPQHADLFTLIEGEEANSWLAQRRFFDRIINACLGEGALRMIEAFTWKDDVCLRVSTEDVDGVIVDVLVDPLTMYPIAEIETLPDGTIKQTVFSDYRIVSGMPLPFHMASSVSDEPKSHIQINNATLNIGVFSELFEVPESLLKQ